MVVPLQYFFNAFMCDVFWSSEAKSLGQGKYDDHKKFLFWLLLLLKKISACRCFTRELKIQNM